MKGHTAIKFCSSIINEELGSAWTSEKIREDRKLLGGDPRLRRIPFFHSNKNIIKIKVKGIMQTTGIGEAMDN